MRSPLPFYRKLRPCTLRTFPENWAIDPKHHYRAAVAGAAAGAAVAGSGDLNAVVRSRPLTRRVRPTTNRSPRSAVARNTNRRAVQRNCLA